MYAAKEKMVRKAIRGGWTMSAVAQFTVYLNKNTSRAEELGAD